MFLEDPHPDSLKTLDLFSVSELRRPKGGGMEIKFVDRMLALQRLHDLTLPQKDPQNAILPLYDALNALHKDSAS